MFSLKDFIKKGLLDAIGKMSDYQIILNAAGWHEKGVLDEADLAQLDAAIAAYSAAQESEETAADNESGE